MNHLISKALLLVFGVCFSIALHGQTLVCCTLASNTTWTLQGSPYVLTADVTVPAGISLTVDAGVSIQGNGYSIQVSGGLRMLGMTGAEIEVRGTMIAFNSCNLSNSSMEFVRFASMPRAVGLYGSCTGVMNCVNATFQNTGVAAPVPFSGKLRFSESNFLNTAIECIPFSPGHAASILIVDSHLAGCTIRSKTQQNVNSLALVISRCTLDSCHLISLPFGGYGIEVGESNLRFCLLESHESFTSIHQSDLYRCTLANPSASTNFAMRFIFESCRILHCDIKGNAGSGGLWGNNSSLQACLVEIGDGNVLDCDILTNTLTAFLGNGAGIGLNGPVINSNRSLFYNFGTAANITVPQSPWAQLYGDDCNFIQNGTNMACYNPDGVRADYCFWGSTDSTDIAAKIIDSQDNVQYGAVIAQPWWTTPDTLVPISPPVMVAEVPQVGQHRIIWNPNPEADVAGYYIYLAPQDDYSFFQRLDVGNVTSYHLPDSLYNLGIAVTAYDRGRTGSVVDMVQGHESGFSRALSGSVAMEPPQNSGKLTIFPNPADQSVTLSLDHHHSPATYAILDIHGRTVLAGEVLGNMTHIDVEALPRGAYVALIVVGNRRYAQRLVLH